MRLNKAPEQARGLFERAIEIVPTLTEARLNLGNLLSSYFKDPKGAANQYEAAIASDPGDPRAYNNLANLFRDGSEDPPRQARIRELLETALRLNESYAEARLNYENFLSESIGDFDAADLQLDVLEQRAPEAKDLVHALRERNALLRKRAMAAEKPA